jgi:hypothetical protein
MELRRTVRRKPVRPRVFVDVHVPTRGVECAPGDTHPGGMAEERHGGRDCGTLRGRFRVQAVLCCDSSLTLGDWPPPQCLNGLISGPGADCEIGLKMGYVWTETS